jgi:hypothetical protein
MSSAARSGSTSFGNFIEGGVFCGSGGSTVDGLFDLLVLFLPRLTLGLATDGRLLPILGGALDNDGRV